MNRRALHFHLRPKSGMVLLEVIAALGIFVMVAFSLVLALHAALEAAQARNEIDTATRGLANQMALLHAGRVIPVDKDLPDDGSGFTYHLTIEPEQVQNQKHQQVTGMYRATITAKWKSDGQAEDRSISELIYQP